MCYEILDKADDDSFTVFKALPSNPALFSSPLTRALESELTRLIKFLNKFALIMTDEGLE